MSKNLLYLSVLLSFSAVSIQAEACMDHYFYEQGYNTSIFNPSQAGARSNSFREKRKVFTVEHAPATVVVIDEDSNLKVDYDLPPTSKNVSLQFAGGNNVELIDHDIQLTDLNGTATARFRVTEQGVDTITVTVIGEHEGQVVSYSSKIYINAKLATTS